MFKFCESPIQVLLNIWPRYDNKTHIFTLKSMNCLNIVKKTFLSLQSSLSCDTSMLLCCLCFPLSFVWGVQLTIFRLSSVKSPIEPCSFCKAISLLASQAHTPSPSRLIQDVLGQQPFDTDYFPTNTGVLQSMITFFNLKLK